MCGIGGIYNCTGAQTPIDQSMALWALLERRGTHASGIGVVFNNEVSVLKDAKRSLHLSYDARPQIPDSGVQSMLFHTRHATQGSIHENGNNHPITEHGVVMTHNGVLYNDDFVFSDLGVDRVNEVDSEAINAALGFASPQYLADEVQGAMSIAWVEVNNPETVHLFTNGGNPLVIGRTKGGNIVWASGLDYIDEAGFNLESHFHALPFKVYDLNPDGTITSGYVSEQRADPDMGWRVGSWARQPSIVSTPNRAVSSASKSSVGKSPKKTKKARQNRRKGAKKGKRFRKNYSPVHQSKKTNHRRLKNLDSQFSEEWLTPWDLPENEGTGPEDWAWSHLRGWIRRDEA